MRVNMITETELLLRKEEAKHTKEKIEAGDTVIFKENILVKDLTDTDLHIPNKLLKIIGESTIMTVKGFVNDGDIEVEENDYVWSPNWLEIVEKAPKTLYFDVRRTTGYRYQIDDTQHLLKYHGKEKYKCGEVAKRINYAFTTEKPEPLKIIDGVVK